MRRKEMREINTRYCDICGKDITNGNSYGKDDLDFCSTGVYTWAHSSFSLQELLEARKSNDPIACRDQYLIQQRIESADYGFEERKGL